MSEETPKKTVKKKVAKKSTREVVPAVDDIDIPEAASAVKDYDVVDAFGYDTAFNMALIGAGEAGGRIVSTFYKLGYRRVAAINGGTELGQLPAEIATLDLRTGGAGKDPQTGAAQVADRDEEIFELMTRAFGKDPDYILVCVGLGGGTGGGVAPKLLDIAKKYMTERGKDPNRVGAIVTLPHHAEGYTPCRNAVTCFKQVADKKPSPLLIIDNLRIGELAPDDKKGFRKLYHYANEQVAKLFHLFNRFAATRSEILTFDRADFASLLDSGICVFGASPIPTFDSPADISQAIREQLATTVLAQVDLRRGQKAGCLFVGPPEILDAVPVDFFDGGFSMLTRILSEGSVVHRGIYEGSRPDLRCFTMLAGLPAPSERLKKLASEGGLTGDSGAAGFLGVDDGVD